MGYIDDAPASVRIEMDDNPDIPLSATDRLLRDTEMASRYGLAKKDVQKARAVITEGPGYMERLRSLIGHGILPVGLLAVLASQLLDGGRDE